jgi:disulfide bond formation protein DsbB
MLTHLTARQSLYLILAISLATIAGAWVFEYYGYLPCELCLMQRWAYYAAIPLSAVLLAIPSRPAMRLGLIVLCAVWLGSMVFGAYHAGVEWKWWPGPDTCTGSGALTDGLPDLSKPVVMCDEPAIRIFGLSLAGWNAIISLALAAIAAVGVRAQGSSSVSQ